MFDRISTTENSYSEYIKQVSQMANDMIVIFKEVRAFDKKSALYYDIDKFFGTWPFLPKGFLDGYDLEVEKGWITDQALPFWFSALVFNKLQAVAESEEDIKRIVQEYMEERKMSPVSVFDEIHINWIEYFFNRVNREDPHTWEEEWDSLQDKGLIVKDWH